MLTAEFKFVVVGRDGDSLVLAFFDGVPECIALLRCRADAGSSLVGALRQALSENPGVSDE